MLRPWDSSSLDPNHPSERFRQSRKHRCCTHTQQSAIPGKACSSSTQTCALLIMLDSLRPGTAASGRKPVVDTRVSQFDDTTSQHHDHAIYTSSEERETESWVLSTQNAQPSHGTFCRHSVLSSYLMPCYSTLFHLHGDWNGGLALVFMDYGT